MSDTAPEVAVKSKKLRSPGYPAIDLATAIKRAESFYEKEKRNSAPLRIAAQHWGTSEKSSASLLAVAALKSFGLISGVEGADRRIQLTDLALRIILDKREQSPDRDQALKKAALMPKMHQSLWTKYADNLPSDGSLAHELVFDWRFNENAVRDFIKEYKATILFSKLTSSDRLSVDDGDKDSQDKPPLQTTEFHVGDYIQWESQGVLQFIEPKRIREITEDGKWAYVDGSNTGMPVSQLTKAEQKHDVVQPPENPPPPRSLVDEGPKREVGSHQDTFSMIEGKAMIQWPTSLSRESFEDFSSWLDLIKRKIGRSVKDKQAVNLGDLAMYKSEE